MSERGGERRTEGQNVRERERGRESNVEEKVASGRYDALSIYSHLSCGGFIRRGGKHAIAN